MGASIAILLISGSLRAGSTNTAALRTAQAITSSRVTTVLYGGMLRMFDETRARRFYIDYLSCNVDWEHRFDGAGPL